jgi:hypothetical protein
MRWFARPQYFSKCRDAGNREWRLSVDKRELRDRSSKEHLWPSSRCHTANFIVSCVMCFGQRDYCLAKYRRCDIQRAKRVVPSRFGKIKFVEQAPQHRKYTVRLPINRLDWGVLADRLTGPPRSPMSLIAISARAIGIARRHAIAHVILHTVLRNRIAQAVLR